MQYETGQIIHVETGHKDDTGGVSTRLEAYLVEKGLSYLQGLGLPIVEVVTDASRTLIKLLGMHTE